MFNLIHHDFPTLIQENAEGGRVYLTPDGKKYPSVTTVLSNYGKEGILAWRKKVGEEQANKISREATNRGTGVHNALEKFLKNEDISNLQLMPNVKSLFVRMKNECLQKVDNIHCLETKLFSHELQLAGTVDCIAEYKGVLSVIDFKTSNRLKKKENIGSYFMQGAAYAQMFTEMTKIPINQVVILIGVDSANFCQTMIIRDEEILEYRKELIRYAEEYRQSSKTVEELVTQKLAAANT